MRTLFENRWVLVTGASSGLGAELARRMAEHGAHLVLTARSRDRLEELAQDLRRVNGTRTHVVPVDLADPDGAATLALATELEGSRVRVMALCPGPVRTGFQAAAGIERPGLPIAVLSPQRTVELALAAYARGERLFVPGVVNGLQVGAARLLPRSLTAWATKRTMQRLGRAPKRLRG
jgi:short-subunit dehydrogenase